MSEYPEVIELVPNTTGSYVPDFNVRPATAAPITAYVNPDTLPFYADPPATPRYDSPGRGLSDADMRDFGTDRYGRPVVTRHPITGAAEFNPRLDLPGNDTPHARAAGRRAMDALARNRTTRRLGGRFLGRVARFIPLLGDVIETADVAVSTWQLGRDLWDRFTGHGGAPSGAVTVAGEPAFQGGQCLANYTVSATFDVLNTGTGEISTTFTFPLPNVPGPISGFGITGSGATKQVLVYSRTGPRVIASNTAPNSDYINLRNTQVALSSGGADDCGNAAGEPMPQPVTRTGPGEPVVDRPPRLDSPDFDIPNARDLIDDLLDDIGNGDWDRPVLDPPDLPGIDDIPEDLEPPDRIDPPTPTPECCPSTERSLATIEALLREALQRLQGAGDGEIDLTPCDAEEVNRLPFGGEGLAGIYSAIAAITQSLNVIHTDTKCPPEIAALPMFYEVKRGEIPQLVVIWRKVEGGGSTWSMTIPHPREDIGADYPFSFPEYKKGGNMASLKLTDNSQVIINAFSEPEAEKVMDYITTLIDPAYLPASGLRMVYSKNVADYAEVEVKAEYVKKFQGHKTSAPLWGARISS